MRKFKTFTVAAASLALSAAVLTGISPKATAASINRTPGAFGRYIAPATVERVFTADPSDTAPVFWFVDDDGERWIICGDWLQKITDRADFPVEGQRVTLVMNANDTPDDFEDDYFDDVFWSCCADAED